MDSGFAIQNFKLRISNLKLIGPLAQLVTDEAELVRTRLRNKIKILGPLAQLVRAPDS